MGPDLAGVRVEEVKAGQVRLVLDEGMDPQAVLRAALEAGPVERFGVYHRRLSEVFREAVSG